MSEPNKTYNNEKDYENDLNSFVESDLIEEDVYDADGDGEDDDFYGADGERKVLLVEKLMKSKRNLKMMMILFMIWISANSKEKTSNLH